MDLLECPLCCFLMCEPVTVPCGHTFCRRCISYLPSKCPKCEETLKPRDVNATKNNVLLISAVEKCCPKEVKTRHRIQEKMKAGHFMEALRIIDDGLDLVPEDPSLKLYRAEANVGLLQLPEALHDLDYLSGLRPHWTEGQFCKGNVLLEMGRQTQALFHFHRCLKIQADFLPAKSQIKKILEAEGVLVPEEMPAFLQVVSEFLKEPFSLSSMELSVHEPPRGAEGEDGSYPLQVDEDVGEASVTASPAAADEEQMRGIEPCTAKCSASRENTLSLLDVGDVECPLCIRLFFEPVTTPCGHTFCKNCLERSLDHNLRCPLCKQPLQEYFRSRKFNVTAVLQDMLTLLFPSQLAERKEIHNLGMAELSNLTKDIPIFVCTVAYPGIACPLHIFEPRYRLMMRRCIETGTKKFGMCSYQQDTGFSEYGCMLEILRSEILPDGRSYVETMGGKRFKVLRRSQRDGYHTADIEYIEDTKVEASGELELLQRMHDHTYTQAQNWCERLSPQLRAQVIRQYGELPQKEDDIQASPDGPKWCWWVLSVLQLDPAYQTTVMSLTTLKERLGQLRTILDYFSDSHSHI
ncbi:unnamed protein product [Knipowitschia caucasica]|uniref:LON peptidase N-terminal domain and ring finger 1 n=1 Tax=Knipowitschia caucasica TaxID=637954 RepID=A0AAV2MKX1_KNICA